MGCFWNTDPFSSIYGDEIPIWLLEYATADSLTPEPHVLGRLDSKGHEVYYSRLLMISWEMNFGSDLIMWTFV